MSKVLSYLSKELPSLFFGVVALLTQSVCVLLLLVPLLHFVYQYDIVKIIIVVSNVPLIVSFANIFHQVYKRISEALS